MRISDGSAACNNEYYAELRSSGANLAHVVRAGRACELELDMKPEDGRAEEKRDVAGACISVKRVE